MVAGGQKVDYEIVYNSTVVAAFERLHSNLKWSPKTGGHPLEVSLHLHALCMHAKCSPQKRWSSMAGVSQKRDYSITL